MTLTLIYQNVDSLQVNAPLLSVIQRVLRRISRAKDVINHL